MEGKISRRADFANLIFAIFLIFCFAESHGGVGWRGEVHFFRPALMTSSTTISLATGRGFATRCIGLKQKVFFLQDEKTSMPTGIFSLSGTHTLFTAAAVTIRELLLSGD